MTILIIIAVVAGFRNRWQRLQKADLALCGEPEEAGR